MGGFGRSARNSSMHAVSPPQARRKEWGRKHVVRMGGRVLRLRAQGGRNRVTAVSRARLLSSFGYIIEKVWG
jgi:hypothetical protein